MAEVAAVASVAGPILGGILGNNAASGDRARAQAVSQEAIDIIDSIGAPPDLAKKIIFQKFQEAGILTPEIEQQIEKGFSEYANIKEDPALRDAQMTALEGIQQRGRVGLNAEDRAALNQIRNETQRDSEAKRQQILQQMQARGLGGSGAELISQLNESQGSANRASEESDRLAAMASKNALEALAQQSRIASDVRGQDYGVASNKAAAADAINKFNIQNQAGVQQRNIDRANTAQTSNLAQKQKTLDTNTTVENAERLRQVEAERQRWLDQSDLASKRANVRTGLSTTLRDQADATAQGYGNMGAGAGTALGAIFGKLNKPDDTKPKVP